MKKQDEEHTISRRTFLLAGAQAALLGIVVGRLGYLQLFKNNYYRLLSDGNRLSLRVLAPPRGLIYDRHGSILAYNTKSYRAVLIPELGQIKGLSIAQQMAQAADLLGLGEEDQKHILSEIKKRPKFVPTPLRENIPWEDVARIDVNLLDLPAIQIEETTRRSYPFPELCAHVLGYVGSPTEAEEEADPELVNADVKVGKNGFEKLFDTSLRGVPGLKKAEVNSRGRRIRDISQDDPKPGEDLTITLDLELQETLMEQLMEFPSAAGVLLDVHTGDILALGSTPSFDPNVFRGTVSKEAWQAISKNPFHPLISKVTGGLYAPGSVYKLCVALAALEKGTIDSQTSVFCPGFLNFGNHRFHCHKKEGHGTVRLKDAIKKSCDVYFYEIGHRMGIDAVAPIANQLGLGLPSELNWPGEKHGIIPTKEWKQKRLGQPWTPGETLIAAIGQGFVLSTPLELAVMTARLVNGGYAVHPRICKTGSIDFAPINIAKKNLDTILDAMQAVTNEPGGTGFSNRITEPGFEMGGKTGTSQVRRISMGERQKGLIKHEDTEWKYRDHALFVGYAPVQAPRYACSILVEHGGHGGTTAIPIARKLLIAAQKQILP